MSFFNPSELTPIRTQRVPQNIETPVTFVEVPGAYVRYAYARSSESMASQIEGQDYLCFKHNDQRFVGVVCDGVGSSFCGNLAARILGDNLLEWLWSLDIPYVGGPAGLGEAAAAYLNRLQKQAQIEVMEYEIPGEITGLIRQALENQRSYGSEAVWAAVRIDHASPAIPNGLVSILWMGDTTIRALNLEGQAIEFGGAFANANRWSTVHGVRGQMSSWMGALSDVGRVILHSDGLSAHAGALQDYSDDRLDREIRHGAKLPSSDDVSFLDIVARSPIYDGHPDPDFPDPEAERPVLEQIWNPNASPSYELRWNWSGKKASFLIQEATNPALTDARTYESTGDDTHWRPFATQAPGRYYYRVRAMPRWGRMTPWSDLRYTRVAYPPPAAPMLQLAQGSSPSLEWAAEGETLDFRLEKGSTPAFEDAQLVYEGRGNSYGIPASHLKPGSYYYRICAVTDGGVGPWSTPCEVTVHIPPPPKPHLGPVSMDPSRGAYLFRWQGVPGAKRYEMAQRLDGAERLHTIDGTQWSIDNLEPGDYEFALRACNEYACSEWSAAQYIQVLPPAPQEAPIPELEGPDEEGHVSLRWEVVAHADRYAVQIGEDEAFANPRNHETSEPEIAFTRRDPGLLLFRVAGRGPGGDGPWSEPLRLEIAPRPPAWIEVKPRGDGSLELAWGAVGGRVQYRVESLPDEAQAGEKLYFGPETQARAGFSKGQRRLNFRVRAEAGAVSSEWTYSDLLEAPPALPAPLLKPAKLRENGSYWIEWDPAPGADHYDVEVSTGADFRHIMRSMKAEGTAITFQAPSGGMYYLRIVARRGPEASAPSNPISVDVQGRAEPHLWPAGPFSPYTPFDIEWEGVPGSKFYELQYSATESFTERGTRQWQIMHPAQRYQHPAGLPTGISYWRARAYGENGKPGPWSTTLKVEIR